MALRAVPHHPKFADLMARMGRPRYVALGCLEAVWHFTGRFTPQGNIGKYTDMAIETWVGWDGAPGELIAALIDTRWIDRNDSFRLVVHDWPQHADNATKLALKRSGKLFCLHTVATVSRQSSDTVPQNATPLRLPEPVPVPEPVPEPEAKTKAKAAPPKAPLFVLPAWISSEVWKDFEEMRRKIKAPLTDRARRNLVADLVRIEATGQHAEDVLNQSITNSWRGVFPIKTDGVGNGRGGGSYGNRGQARTDGNLEAARSAAEAIAGKGSDWAGGGPASIGERRDAETLQRAPV